MWLFISCSGRKVVYVCLFLRERDVAAGQRAARSLHSAPPPPTKEQQKNTERLYKEQKIQTKIHMNNLKVGAFAVRVQVGAVKVPAL